MLMATFIQDAQLETIQMPNNRRINKLQYTRIMK